ncbi:uncharacterized protein LOC123500144 isoform X1 [Portunus trituberculatus]|uniref:uncharacterized protein LOC123500144 isoform X1 n=1 Tax=Portunus trituberculatus TaxID=210409 RepID=UPI001E1D13CA|nr:uncharacterized protein LOC123500144 isoform X1 [Portunus trituberculatus]
MTVAADLVVELAPLRYKYLEIIRNRELTRNHGDYSATINLDSHAKDLIHWWVHNIDCQTKSLRPSFPQLELYADASLTGWGASMGTVKTGGHWVQEELDHINVLEIKAILMGLSSLCKNHRDTHVRLRSDNIATVIGLGRVGSTKPSLNAVIEEIFAWAESRGITLSAEHVKGLYNAEADFKSRVRNLDAEWMLHPEIFKFVCGKFFTPDIDLFATRINAQLPVYVSWRPDPTSTYVNAFTISWSIGNLYAFPSFSVICRVLEKIQVEGATVLAILPLWPTQVWFPRALQLFAAPPLLLPPNPIFLPEDPSLSHPQGRRIIGRVLQKIQEDRATVMTILPLWPTQVWFLKALQQLVGTPLLLPRHSLILPQYPSLIHPQAQKLILVAMILSGNPSKIKAFCQRLPDFCLTHGERAQKHNMGNMLTDGCQFVAGRKLIHFHHL